MNVYIVEIDSLDDLNESTVRIFYSTNDPNICSVFVATSGKERRIAKNIISESKQEEIERYSLVMLNQHNKLNKNYMVCKTEKPATKHQILKHVINNPNIKDCLIKF